MNNKISACELCSNYVYDEQMEEYECMVSMDEDEVVAFLHSNTSCPYFRLDDEYGIVRKQN